MRQGTTLQIYSPAAFARTSGGWFVLADSNIHACFAAPCTAATGEETLSGPYSSQAKAAAAMGNTLACGSQ